MRILFLPNWKVQSLEEDSAAFQAPDKQINDQPYWFFRYFPKNCRVDIVDFQQPNWLSYIEKKINAYIWQGFKAFARQGHYDVVVSHGAQSGLMYSLLRTITFRRAPLHVIFDIGSMNGGRRNKLENAFIAFALKSRPFIICHSKVIIENYKHTYRDLVSRARFIPFGVDTTDFYPREQVASKSYVLAFGSAKRDYPTLLAAWGGLKTDIKLRVIGYKGQTALPNVEIVDKVSIEELKKQIANALFVVVPLPVFNYSYGQMTFLQSMSMGKTVIVTETPSSIDYLRDGEGAFFVKPNHAEDMRAKIQWLLNNPEVLEQSNKKARSYVTEHFSEAAMAEKIYAAISSITPR